MKMLGVHNLVCAALAIASGAILFMVSQNVQQHVGENKHLVEKIQQEKDTIRVLRAEWDYLNRPERLELLAHTTLNMAPAQVERIGFDTVATLVASPMIPKAKPAVPASFKRKMRRAQPRTVVAKVEAAPSPAPQKSEPTSEDVLTQRPAYTQPKNETESFDQLLFQLTASGGGR